MSLKTPKYIAPTNDHEGGNIEFLPGEHIIAEPVFIGGGSSTGPVSNIIISGQGSNTVLKRGASMGAGLGVLNIYGDNITLKDFVIEGNQTTPLYRLYSALGNPIDGVHDLNSSIWIHPGSSNITLENITIRHSAGYAVVIDARAGNITNVRVINSTFENNRGHQFGVVDNDCNYGSWSGGIFYVSSSTGGATSVVDGLTVYGCTFSRITGIGVWGWSAGFDTQHKNVNINNNTFTDIGRDCIEPGNTSGGSIIGNTGKRIGYIVSNDDDSSYPRWAAGGPNGVFIDSTGYNSGFVITGNSVVDINGGAFDLDGLANSIVCNNTAIIENPAGYGPGGIGNCSYGIQPGNTYNPKGAHNLIITNNTLKYMGYWAMSCSNLKNSLVANNNITHASTAYGAPIVIYCKPGYSGSTLVDGNTEGANADFRSHGNTFTGNRIDYAAAQFAICEIVYDDGTSHHFKSTDVNRVFGNIITGASIGEFLKDSHSGSFTGLDLATNDATSTSADTSRIQREGKGATAATKTYAVVGGTKTQVQQISDAGFLNVSTNGTAGTGAIATGNRTLLPFADVVASSKVCVDGFLSLTDTTFNAAQANLLDASYILFRRDATNGLQVSTSVNAGARVWSNLGGLPSWVIPQDSAPQTLTLACNVPATSGVGNQSPSLKLQYNTWTGSASVGRAISIIASPYDNSTGGSLAFYCDGANPTYSNAMLRLNGAGGLTSIHAYGSMTVYGMSTTLGVSGAAGVTLTNGWFQSNDTTTGGFVTLCTSATSINTAGGMKATLGYTTEQSVYFKSYAATTSLNAPGAGYAALAHKSGTTYWLYNGSSWVAVDFSAVGGGVTTITGTANQVIASGSTGAVTLSLPQAINTGADVSFNALSLASSSTSALSMPNGYVLCKGLAGTSTAYNAVQASAGGMYAALSYTTDQSVCFKSFAASATLNSPGAGYGALAHKAGSQYWLFNGSSWVTVDLAVGGGVTSITGTTNQITASGSTGTITLSLPQAIHTGADVSFNALSLASSSTSALSMPNGSILSKGLAASGTAYNTIQTSAGGMYAALGFTTDQSVYFKSFASATMNAPGIGYGSIAHRTGTSYWLYNGSSWVSVDFASVGGGVTSLTAGTGISLNGSTGAITVTNAGVTSINGYSGTPSFVAGTGISISGLTITNTSPHVNPVAGTGISVSGNTVTNTGVTSINGYSGTPSFVAGTGISISGLTITNTATSITYTAGTGVSLSSNQISIGQAVGTGNAVTFSSVYASTYLQSGATGLNYTFCNANSTFIVNGNGAITCSGAVTTSGGLAVTTITNYNSIQTSGGVSVSQGFYVGTTNVINSSSQFVGAGVNVGSSYGVAGRGFNPNNGTQYTGQDLEAHMGMKYVGGVAVRSWDATLTVYYSGTTSGWLLNGGTNPPAGTYLFFWGVSGSNAQLQCALTWTDPRGVGSAANLTNSRNAGNTDLSFSPPTVIQTNGGGIAYTVYAWTTPGYVHGHLIRLV